MIDKRKFFLGLLSIVVSLGLAEGYARWKSRGPKWTNPYYLEMSQGFPELEGFLNDRDIVFSQPQRYYDEFLYGPEPISLTHLTFTDYFSARLTPDSVPLEQAEHIIWLFGGSTMMNMETTDRQSIANTMAIEFNKALGPTHVKNFGQGSFISSYELIKFQRLLREIPEEELPSIAVFYDGYNDANNTYQFGAGKMQRDLVQKLEFMVESQDLKLIIYAASRGLSEHSEFWNITGARVARRILLPPTRPDASSDNLGAGVDVYLHNQTMTKAICQAYDIECFFILQPLIVTKTPLSPLESEVFNKLMIGSEGINFVQKFYDQIRLRLIGDTHFIDASGILNGRMQPDFYDLGHTAASSSSYIGQKIAGMVIDRLPPESWSTE